MAFTAAFTAALQSVSNAFKVGLPAAQIANTITGYDKLKDIMPQMRYIDDFKDIVSDTFVPKNPNYVITLTKKTNDGDLRVRGTMPKDFTLQHQNDGTELSTLAANLIPSQVAGLMEGLGRAATIGLALNGTNLTRFGNFYLWTGSHPLQFNLSLRFDAYKNPKTEVIGPVQTLLHMAAGKAVGPALQSPWPSLKDVMAAGKSSQNFLLGLNNCITIDIGTHTRLAGMVIDAIGWKWAARAHRGTGLPIYAEAEIQFRSIIGYSQDEYLTAFGGSRFTTQREGTINERADRRAG